jgi:hypothetical protein
MMRLIGGPPWRGAALLVFGVFLGLTSPAHATLELVLSDGLGHKATVQDTSGTGIVSFTGSIGNFNVTVTTATSKPLIGNPYSAQLDLTNFSISSSGGGTLTVTAFDTNYSVIPGSSNSGLFSVSNQGNLFGNGSVTASSWFDSTNTGYPVPNSAVPLDVSGFGGSQALVSLGADNFALVEQIKYTTTGGGGSFVSIDFDTALTSPAPSGLVLALTCLPPFGLGYWHHHQRRRRSRP